MYTGKDLSECFANLHMTFDKEIQKVNHEMVRISEKVSVLTRFHFLPQISNFNRSFFSSEIFSSKLGTTVL
jgi:hypothetical protein